MKQQEVRARTEQILRLLDDLMAWEAIFGTRHTVVLRGVPRIPTDSFAATAQARLEVSGYHGTIESVRSDRSDSGSVLITVPLREDAARIPWVNIALFGGTVATTVLLGGVDFAAWFLAILLCHEFGHFLAARRRRIDASWPYFIPAPNILGTFGAFIRLRSPIRDRVALFDMAVAGPLAGFAVSVAALFVGLARSSVVTGETAGAGLILGDSLLFKGIAALVLPGVTGDQQILLHPIAFAGWAGLLVTMFNLLPMGQLDGGHIAYAIMGRHQRWLALGTIAFLVAVSLWWPWWLMWVAIGLLMRVEHPPTIVDEIPIGRKRRILGVASLLLFVLCFTPVPFAVS